MGDGGSAAWIPRRSRNSDERVVHTDPDCQNLKEARKVREATEAEKENLRACKRCEGTIDKSSNRSRDTYEALRNADSLEELSG